MVRFIVMYEQPLDAAAFDAHYVDRHLPLAKRLPGLRRYSVSRSPVAVRGPQPYLVADLEWTDRQALRQDFESDLGRQLARDVDELSRLCSGVRSFIVEFDEL